MKWKNTIKLFIALHPNTLCANITCSQWGRSPSTWMQQHLLKSRHLPCTYVVRISDDSQIHQHCCENPKPHKLSALSRSRLKDRKLSLEVRNECSSMPVRIVKSLAALSPIGAITKTKKNVSRRRYTFKHVNTGVEKCLHVGTPYWGFWKDTFLFFTVHFYVMVIVSLTGNHWVCLLGD